MNTVKKGLLCLVATSMLLTGCGGSGSEEKTSKEASLATNNLTNITTALSQLNTDKTQTETTEKLSKGTKDSKNTLGNNTFKVGELYYTADTSDIITVSMFGNMDVDVEKDVISLSFGESAKQPFKIIVNSDETVFTMTGSVSANNDIKMQFQNTIFNLNDKTIKGKVSILDSEGKTSIVDFTKQTITKDGVTESF